MTTTKNTRAAELLAARRDRVTAIRRRSTAAVLSTFVLAFGALSVQAPGSTDTTPDATEVPATTTPPAGTKSTESAETTEPATATASSESAATKTSTESTEKLAAASTAQS